MGAFETDMRFVVTEQDVKCLLKCVMQLKKLNVNNATLIYAQNGVSDPGHLAALHADLELRIEKLAALITIIICCPTIVVMQEKKYYGNSVVKLIAHPGRAFY
jgi:predicted ATP-grasp superfamily ATP-dependent carboligase